MADDDTCSICGREGSSMHVIVLDTGEHGLACPECDVASGDDLIVPGFDEEAALF